MTRLSIITINLNKKTGLQKTMASVLSQTFTDYEYIIIDGGSTDGSLDVIKQFEDRITFWVSEKDDGIYDAMNKALKFAKGEWVNFLNSGDTYYQSETLTRIFSQEVPPNIDVIHGNIIIKDDNYSTTFHYNKFMMKMTYRYCHQAAFVRTKYHKLFDTNYKIVADLDVLIEFINQKRIKYIEDIVVDYEDNGVSKINLPELYKERRTIILTKGIWFLIPIEIFSFYRYRLSCLVGKMRKK